MEASTVLRNLVECNFMEIFKQPAVAASWEQFIQEALKQGQFIVLLRLSCGCTRVLHYDIIDTTLLYTPGRSRAKHMYHYSFEYYAPKDTLLCSQLPLPIRWAGLPVLVLDIQAKHGFVDSTVGHCIDLLRIPANRGGAPNVLYN